MSEISSKSSSPASLPDKNDVAEFLKASIEKLTKALKQIEPDAKQLSNANEHNNGDEFSINEGSVENLAELCDGSVKQLTKLKEKLVRTKRGHHKNNNEQTIVHNNNSNGQQKDKQDNISTENRSRSVSPHSDASVKLDERASKITKENLNEIEQSNDTAIIDGSIDSSNLSTQELQIKSKFDVANESEENSSEKPKGERASKITIENLNEIEQGNDTAIIDGSIDSSNLSTQELQIKSKVDVANESEENSSEKPEITRITLVPISNLLKNTKDISEPTTSNLNRSRSMKRVSFNVVSNRNNRNSRSNSSTSDLDMDNNRTKHQLRQHTASTIKETCDSNKLTTHDNNYNCKVRLAKFPNDLNKLLHRHNLTEIRDHRQRIIVKKNKIKHNRKSNSICETSDTDKNLTNAMSTRDDNNSDEAIKSPENPFDQLFTNDSNPTKKNSKRPQIEHNNNNENGGNESSSSSDQIKTHRQDYAKESQSLKRNKRQKILSSDDDDSDAKLSTMRKKTQPKSSADLTESESSDSSNEQPTTSKNNVDESNSELDYVRDVANSDSDDMQRPKRRRVVQQRQKNKSDDDYDNDSSDDDSKKKKRRRKRIKKNSDSSDDDDNDKKKGRKNIRKMIKARDLEDGTRAAAKEEQLRKKRIEDRQKMYNQMFDSKLEEINELDKLILDFDVETKEELIALDEKLVKKLKPHQAQGIKFMWDACFESIEKINETPGGGCILAHCMGLGKTLQVVALVHTLLAHSEQTSVEKVLIICPVSTVLNWVNEFRIWLRHCKHNRDIDIYEISKYKQNAERAYQINEWHNDGGVLIIGYDMFRNLSGETSRYRKKIKEQFQRGLVDPGADLVVCDEGHLLKNSKTSLSKAVNRIRTLRRIVLTGTPLQNNLNEYYCMVQFVKPNLLGKYNEYMNRFANPITNGQYTDSTPYDIMMMKRRSHILHKLLDGCVQRKDYSVLAPFLPPKQEFVLYIRLTKLQIELYQYYLANKPSQNEDGKTRSSVLFQDFQNLQRIWTHPRVLRYNSDRFGVNAKKKKDALSEDEDEGSLKDFIDDDEDDLDSDDTACDSSSSDCSSVLSVDSAELKGSKKKGKSQVARRTRANAQEFQEPEPEPIEPIKEENPTEWWMPMCPEEELNNLEHSGKLMLLFSILAECEAIGDKLLVFSQSLFSLDVIEHFLFMINDNTKNPSPDAKLGGCTGSWTAGRDYFRLDGSTPIESRNAACNSFNHETNTRARLFLISTRAGGLGINLVAANRVIIFDVSWNPSHDIQSIFRVYRFGQKKPCYIYRFIALGTMEEKIYERQVTKLAISKRVIDEHQIDRHYKENDLNELYKTELEPEEERPQPILPKDRLFAEQLRKFEDSIYKYHEHDSLLENKCEETLSTEEIQAAWKEFEEEKSRPTVQQTFIYTQQPRVAGSGPVTSNQIFGFRSDILLQLLNIKARRDYPSATTQAVTGIVPLLLKHLYETMQSGDTTFYQELLNIQTEMMTPGMNINNFNAGTSMPTYSGRGRPPLNPQPSQQQQQLIEEAQNRLMNINNGNPTISNQIIEID